MKYKDFYKEILMENIISHSKIESEIYSAFRLAFDISKDDIGKLYSADGTFRSVGISTDFRVPNKANTAVMGMFQILYKSKYYRIDFRLVNWNENPTEEDFTNHAHGKDLKGHGDAVEKKEIDTEKPITAVVDIFESKVTKSNYNGELYESDEIMIGTVPNKFYDKSTKFYQYIVPKGSFYEMAMEVKKVIDGRDKNKESEKSPEPLPTNTKEVDVYNRDSVLVERKMRYKDFYKELLTEGRKEDSIEVAYVQDDQLQDDDLDAKFPDFLDQINYLEKTSNIHILRNKELNQVLIVGDKIVGALYTELDSNDVFSFDIIVHPEYRGKGLGDKLVKLGIDEYKSLKNSLDHNIKLRVDVVNPQLFNTLKKNGLRVLKNLDTNRKLMGI